MPKFAKLTKVNTNGQNVGTVYVNVDMIVAMFVDPLYDSKFTNLITESTAIILVKETPEQIIQGFVVEMNDASNSRS